jgi:hypothetical protein
MRRTFTVSLVAIASVAASLAGARVTAAPSDADALNVTLVSGLKCSGPGGLADCAITRGTHLEFMTRVVDGATHVFALEGSRDLDKTTGWDTPGGGLNIIDITDPTVPTFVTNVPCRTDNLDIAAVTFDDPATQPLVNGVRYDTVFALASNDTGTGCSVLPRGVTDAKLAVKGNSVQFAGIRAGARLVPGTQEVDFLGGGKKTPVAPLLPDGKPFTAWAQKFAHTVVKWPGGPIVYADNQNVQTDRQAPTIEIIDLHGLVVNDAAGQPQWHPVVRSLPLTNTAVGPHDITFSPDGSRAFVSSINESFIWDTTDPLAPKLVSALAAPGLKIHHEGTLAPDGRHLLVVDEFVATSSNGTVTATPQCPGGGVHVFDLGDHRAYEAAPPQVGAFFADDVSNVTQVPDTNDVQGTAPKAVEVGCTAHEFTISPDGKWMPIAWFGAGLRIFDLTDFSRANAAAAPSPVIVPEVGHYKSPGINVWAAKVHPLLGNYVFTSDEFSGFSVFKYTPPA